MKSTEVINRGKIMLQNKAYLIFCIPLVILAVAAKEYFNSYIPIVAYLAICPALVSFLSSINKSDSSYSLMPTWFVVNVIGFVGYFYAESLGII